MSGVDSLDAWSGSAEVEAACASVCTRLTDLPASAIDEDGKPVAALPAATLLITKG